MSSGKNLTSIKVTPEVRDKVRALKRGQESYDSLLDRMADQFEPYQAGEND